MSNCSFVSDQLAKVLSRIDNACSQADRSRSSVRLIGASKKQSPALIQQFIEHGLRDLGENYLQEALEKQTALSSVSATWHFIGQIQSNKTKPIAQHFDWVHGVARLKIARRLATQRAEHTTSPINILVQLNLDDEDAKGGVSANDAPELCADIASIEGLRLCGFMLIPKPRQSQDKQRRVFSKARQLLEHTNQRHGLKMDQLSMGMSADLEAAIAEGSTMVRIGTDLFGPRD